jgi:hypothetical protein
MHFDGSRFVKYTLVMILGAISTICVGQTSGTSSQSTLASVPRQLRFGGTIKSADDVPRTGVVGVMFSLYSEQQGGVALWTELQNVQLDANGQYSVLLGSQHSEGVPAEVFTTNEARWLGIQVEAEPEQPRVLLVSVPYALKAGDAETLGGRRVSDFLLTPTASGANGSGTTSATATTTQTSVANVQPYSVDTGASGGTAGYIARWADASTLGNSLIYDNGVNVGIGTNSPAGSLDVQLTSGGSAASIISSRTLNNSSPLGGIISAMSLTVTDASTASNLSKQTMRMAYIRDAAATGAVTAFDSIFTMTPVINGNAPYTLVGLNVEGPTIASGKTLSAYYGATIGAPSGSGTATSHYALVTQAGAGNVGINTLAPTSPLTVVGTIESTSGGFKFPDGTTMASATNNTAPTNYTSSTTDQVLYVTQNGAGAGSLTIATLPSAIRGYSSASTGFISGVLGSSASPSGFGVFGENLASSGNAVGTFGVSTTSTTGTGVWGEAESTTGTTVGVYGKSASTNGSLAGGTGVLGYANSTTGDAVGVYGLSDSTTGTGVWGDVSAGTGTTFGVYGRVASASGTAGVFDNTNGGNLLLGRSGSGSTNVFRVDSTGKGYFNGGTQTLGADFAESVEVSGVAADYKPGDVLMIDPTGYRRLALASEPYSTKVAGIYSTKPGVLATPHMMDDVRLAGEVPLAVVGIVPCKVSTENGPIEPGDMLVSSSTAGYAMKGTDRGRMLGAVVGKAMQSLRYGTGVIEVLVTLQ